MFSFIRHLLVAQRRHGVHSPFVYKFGDEYLHKNHYNVMSFFLLIKRKKISTRILNDLIQYCKISHIQMDPSLDMNLTPAMLNEHSRSALLPSPDLHISADSTDIHNISPYSIHVVMDSYKYSSQIQQFYNDTSLPVLILDLYFMCVIIRHDMILEKQYFNLK